MLSGDHAFAPVIKQIQEKGVDALVPEIWETDGTGPGPDGVTISTAGALIGTARYTPSWRDLLNPALDSDYPLIYPFLEPVTEGGPIPRPASDGYWRGAINQWTPGRRQGFLTDRFGRNWYIGPRALPEHTPDPELGQPVRFTGKPRPQPGRDYPEARTILPFNPGQP